MIEDNTREFVKENLYQKVDFVHGGQFQNKQISQKLQLQKQLNQNGQLQKQQQQLLENKISNKWEKNFPIGPGFINLGNTCFLNSVLQSLTYTPALANYLLSDQHSKDCTRTGKNSSNFCCTCLFQQHIQKCFPKKDRAIQPIGIVRNMRYIFKRFRLGRQEDSHEFLRLMVEAMQRGALPYNTKIEYNDPISKIFNGKLKSQIKCLSCDYKSEIFENFMDLSLELKQNKNVNQCLDLFFHVEELSGKNKYKCSGCKKHVNAQKRYLINNQPNVLTLHLKRFNNSMQKINKPLQFPQKLSLKKYVCPTKKVKELDYELFSVLVHQGYSCFSGHYYCYVKNSNGMWFCMNDSSVQQVSIEKVLKENAYILFYNKVNDSSEAEKVLKIKKLSVDFTNSAILNDNVNPNTDRKRKESGELQKKPVNTTNNTPTSNNNNSNNNRKNSKQIELEDKEEQTIINNIKETVASNLQSIKEQDSYKKYMESLDKTFNLNSKSKQAQTENTQNQKKQENKKEEEKPKKEEKVEEEEEQTFQEELILIPGNIRSLQPLRNSKLNHKRKFRSLYKFIKQLESSQNTSKITNGNTNIKQQQQSQQLQPEKQSIIKPKTTLTKVTFDNIDNISKDNALKTLLWGNRENNKEIINKRQQIKENNQEYFEFKQAEKDEYDAEYDKGKTKKIKKKKKPFKIDFQRLYKAQQFNPEIHDPEYITKKKKNFQKNKDKQAQKQKQSI